MINNSEVFGDIVETIYGKINLHGDYELAIRTPAVNYKGDRYVRMVVPVGESHHTVVTVDAVRGHWPGGYDARMWMTLHPNDGGEPLLKRKSNYTMRTSQVDRRLVEKINSAVASRLEEFSRHVGFKTEKHLQQEVVSESLILDMQGTVDVMNSSPAMKTIELSRASIGEDGNAYQTLVRGNTVLEGVGITVTKSELTGSVMLSTATGNTSELMRIILNAVESYSETKEA